METYVNLPTSNWKLNWALRWTDYQQSLLKKCFFISSDASLCDAACVVIMEDSNLTRSRWYTYAAVTFYQRKISFLSFLSIVFEPSENDGLTFSFCSLVINQTKQYPKHCSHSNWWRRERALYVAAMNSNFRARIPFIFYKAFHLSLALIP